MQKILLNQIRNGTPRRQVNPAPLKNLKKKWTLFKIFSSCGVIFKCSCGCPYSSRLALLKHARLKNHQIPEESKNKETTLQQSHSLNQPQKTKLLEKHEPKLAPKICRPEQPLKLILPANQSSQANTGLNESTQFVFVPISFNATNKPQMGSSYTETENQQRSFGCQTKLNQPTNNETQEIACQTIYNSLIEVTKNTDQYHEYQTPYFTNTSTTSTQVDQSFTDPFSFQSQNEQNRSYQSQKSMSSQTLQSNDDYMNMIISDISTQTQLTSFSTVYSQTGMDTPKVKLTNIN